MAAENKHTPGPWEIGDEWADGSIGVYANGAPDGDRMPALVTRGPNVEANAHLIAAAPALLDALRDARNDILYAYERERSAGPMSRYGARLKFIDAALAAAEGETVRDA